MSVLLVRSRFSALACEKKLACEINSKNMTIRGLIRIQFNLSLHDTYIMNSKSDQDKNSVRKASDNSAPKLSAAKGLFLGQVHESALFPFPKLSDQEQETLTMVLESIDRFMEGKSADYREYDTVGNQPESYLDQLKELGLFGLIIPEQYGGIGLSNSGYARVIQQTSRYDGSTSLTIGAHSSIGMKGLLLFGTEEQKLRYAPKLASGEYIAAFCLTEPGSGSDAGSIKTTASKNSDGSYTLNGSKLWITNGGWAQFYTVFARTEGDGGKLSAFIVERSYPGVSCGPKEDKMGIRASCTTTVDFNNVKVPKENLLGEEGKGFKIAMAILNNGRTGLGGGCVGAMKRCLKLAIKQATERKQFNKSISEFDLVKGKLAQIAVDIYTTESIVAEVGHYIDSGYDDYSIEAAISKVYASEALWRTANEALQIAGGNGFMKEFPYEMVVRDSRINLIFEGTNEILRLYIALSGLKDAGDYLKDVGKGITNIFNDPIKGFGVLSEYAGRKVSQVTSFGRTKLQHVPEELREQGEFYQHYTKDLAKASEALLKHHGKNIIGKQFDMARIADIAIDLMVGLSTLSRVSSSLNERGAANCTDEIGILKIFSHQAKTRINHNIRRLVNNEDSALRGLADLLIKDGDYKWDLL